MAVIAIKTTDNDVKKATFLTRISQNSACTRRSRKQTYKELFDYFTFDANKYSLVNSFFVDKCSRSSLISLAMRILKIKMEWNSQCLN